MCPKQINNNIHIFSSSVLSASPQRTALCEIMGLYPFSGVTGLLFIQITSVRLFLKLFWPE